MRQTEENLIKAVQELCDGTPSNDTISFLRGLDRELTAVPENAAVTYLFGKRFDVQMYNQMMLDEMPGEQKVFLSDDEGISRFNCDTLKCKKRISS